jgi:mono/diheme cytochrome c family protein
MKYEHADKHPSIRQAFVRPALIGLAAAAFALLATPGSAQEGGDVWGKGGCTACHGGLAQGGGGGEMPAGPNLRRTRLTPADLKETIACGRGEMPFHLEAAYKTVACYGIPIPGPAAAPQGAALTAQEIDALVNFLVTNVVGQTTITRANCALFNGGNANSPVCATYR